MEQTSMSALLLADEERLRHTLRANDSIEKCREHSVETLSEEFGSLLLRYNAACGSDRMRQALADCVTAAARDSLGLLKAAGAEKETPRRESSGWAMLLLLIAVIAAAAGVLLLESIRLAGILCAAAAVIAAFAAGRLWFRRQEVTVRPTLDADALWLGVKRTSETMDRKIDAFCERAAEWAQEREKAGAGEALDEETLRLFGDLLEALYADNGDFALRQLKKIRPCLRAIGIETADFNGENADQFELFPSKKPGLTLRPALLAGDRLLLAGRATEQAD
ncbi:MAG: hypothetical protein ACSW8E_00105 [Clostridia bacterium]